MLGEALPYARLAREGLIEDLKAALVACSIIATEILKGKGLLLLPLISLVGGRARDLFRAQWTRVSPAGLCVSGLEGLHWDTRPAITPASLEEECPASHGITGPAPSRAQPGMAKPVETPSKLRQYLLWFNTLERAWTGNTVS
eukprot:superscaffoldBa00000015_g286